MTTELIGLQKILSPKKRVRLKTTLFLVLLLLLGVSATIPFIYESQSLWYKFGINKFTLRMGKIAGLFAANFLLLQVVLAIRLPLFDKIFGLDKVYFFHRINALVVALLATLHATLVIVPEGIDNLPVGWKFWPEMVGAAVLSTLFIIILSSWFRHNLLPFKHWRKFHRPAGYLLIFGITVHILFVSDSFEKAVPKWSLITLIILILVCVLVTKYHYLKQSGRTWEILEASPLNRKVVSLIIRPLTPFSYLPGQFAFLAFSGKGISSEPHPFTIASSPADGEYLQFMIKKNGNWTTQIEKMTQETLSLQGPFGQFSHQIKNETQHIVFIAAGIGITPMLSMLRQIASSTQQPQVTLIWSLRRRSEMFLEEEFQILKIKTPSLKIHLAFTQEGNKKRLNRQRIEKLLSPCPRDCHIYLCGPLAMMKQTRKALVLSGFQNRTIFWEQFSL